MRQGNTHVDAWTDPSRTRVRLPPPPFECFGFVLEVVGTDRAEADSRNGAQHYETRDARGWKRALPAGDDLQKPVVDPRRVARPDLLPSVAHDDRRVDRCLSRLATLPRSARRRRTIVQVACPDGGRLVARRSRCPNVTGCGTLAQPKTRRRPPRWLNSGMSSDTLLRQSNNVIRISVTSLGRKKPLSSFVPRSIQSAKPIRPKRLRTTASPSPSMRLRTPGPTNRRCRKPCMRGSACDIDDVAPSGCIPLRVVLARNSLSPRPWLAHSLMPPQDPG